MFAALSSVLPGHFVAWRCEQSARCLPTIDLRLVHFQGRTCSVLSLACTQPRLYPASPVPRLALSGHPWVKRLAPLYLWGVVGRPTPKSSVAKARWSWARAEIATGSAFVLHGEFVFSGRHMTALVVDGGTRIPRNLGWESRSGAVTGHDSSIPAWFFTCPRTSYSCSVRGRQAAAP